nr:hypothetical protein [uncultured Hyphomonas sp.]
MDVFAIFNVLAEFLGKYWAGALIAGALAVSGVYGYYFKIVLPDGKRFEGDGENAAEERERYLKWRDRLTRGGTIPALYDGLLVQALDRVDRFFGDEPLAARGGRPATWTGPALDRCLTLALIYPIMSLMIIWHITGLVGPAEAALGMPDGTSPFARGLSAVSLICLVAASFWMLLPPGHHRTFKWTVIRVALFAVLILVAGTGAGAGVGAGAVAFAVAGAFAGAVAVAFAVVGAVAFAVARAFAVAFVVIVILVVAGAVGFAVAVAGAVADERARRGKRHLLYLLSFIVVCVALILGFVAGLTPLLPVQRKPEWTLLAFFGALPVINAFFDWLSLGLTRFLLRRGQLQGSGWPIVYAMVDLATAVVMLVAVMAASLLFLDAMNNLSLAGGGNTVLDIEGLIQDLRTDPGNPALWWVYVTVFSTFVPSLMNLMLGGLAVMRGIPGLPRMIVRHMLPENPARLTLERRAIASAGVTFQIAVAFTGALLVGFLVIGIVLKGLGLIGLGLVDIADWLV